MSSAPAAADDRRQGRTSPPRLPPWARLTAFFHEHNVRYPHIIEQRIQAIHGGHSVDRATLR